MILGTFGLILGDFRMVWSDFKNAEAQSVFTQLNQVSKITTEYSVHLYLIGFNLILPRIGSHLSNPSFRPMFVRHLDPSL